MKQGRTWRPTVADLDKGIRSLSRRSAGQFSTRKRILLALRATPEASVSEIARLAATGSEVVSKLLARWQTRGIESILEQGRPSRFTSEDVALLKEKLRLRKPSSRDSVRAVVRDVLNLQAAPDARTLRRLLNQAAYIPNYEKRPWKLHPSWSEENINQLAAGNDRLRKRLLAIHYTCAHPEKSLHLVTREKLGSKEERRMFYRNLKSITPRTTLEAFLRPRVRGLIVDRLGGRKKLHQWADVFLRTNHRSPTLREAADKILNMYGIELSPKSIFPYLDDWKKINGLKRDYQRHNEALPR